MDDKQKRMDELERDLAEARIAKLEAEIAALRQADDPADDGEPEPEPDPEPKNFYDQIHQDVVDNMTAAQFAAYKKDKDRDRLTQMIREDQITAAAENRARGQISVGERELIRQQKKTRGAIWMTGGGHGCGCLIVMVAGGLITLLAGLVAM